MIAMEQGIVEEWLSEFKALPETSIASYAASLKDKSSLVPALYKVIRETQNELLEPVCHQLFEFYRSGDVRLQRFTLQFLPEFIWCYLSVAVNRDLHSSGCIEALLLGIYNLEIVDKDGQSKVLSFSIPSLSKPSMYHEPSTFGSLALTEGALAKHGLTRVVYSGPHPQRETFTAQNRFEVLTVLLLCYNASLSYLSSMSLQSLCRVSSRISICGFPRQNLRRFRGLTNRMPVSSEFLVQLITGIYYALYNGESELACKALDDVLYRAQLELYPEPLLVGNAIKSSLPEGALKSNKEGARCIQVEITPTSSRISRNAVTSMSIRGHRWKRHDALDLTSPEELMEISEVDEGFCSRAPSVASPPVIVISNSSSNVKTPGKSQRRLGGGKASKERESSTESCKDHLSRKQAPRAMSENLELLSIKRLTLTTSQSLPKAGSLSLARTATAVFSKSFEQVSNVFGVNNQSSSANSIATDTNRYSACSLQEEKLAYGADRVEHLSPNHQQKQRSPSISIQLSSD
ncbi:hyccin isoform X1 [Erpetoichthys calabaricus]|uniref:hyccin isoform X1 n=1 Tax=Erpetoichthys calabaricus TaxID=27687 RepID=UPI0022341AD5|nr:hyccin isoform X1 [Erpetoichthys calabaricus]XP_028674125.2 hyccin isoform X1 [Erpetoichthys calabaricus]XP_028674126.2 hyccin isoform X1 [Erpetoichthys calabaricus]XP_028674127.2 hyccin isoform X1 [Erpetoichthys calabaricus]XP_028674128.2 hyccin isoform X1 [Erpetoichthys calabaricus]